MLNVIVYGPGCAKCKETERRVRHVIDTAGIDATITHATDIIELARLGVMTTPAVTVDGILKSSGRVPDEADIRSWFN